MSFRLTKRDAPVELFEPGDLLIMGKGWHEWYTTVLDRVDAFTLLCGPEDMLRNTEV